MKKYMCEEIEEKHASRKPAVNGELKGE